MAFSLEDHMAKMERRVTSGERDGMETAVVYASRRYPTDTLDLWDAVTNPDRLSRWFLPVSGDLRQGGRYQFEGNAGGTIKQCDPPEQVSATWEYGGGISWVTLRLIPEGDGTRLELEHEAHLIPGFTDVYGPGAVGVGWDTGFVSLARHLEEPETPEPDGWETSPEAMGFYRSTSAAWGQAAIAAGTPEEEAFAAAEATRAFYSGETPPMDPGEGQAGEVSA